MEQIHCYSNEDITSSEFIFPNLRYLNEIL